MTCMGNHEDDWDRNRCWGHHDDWNDRGMGMSAFDSPEEEKMILDAVLKDQALEEERKVVKGLLGFLRNKQQENRMETQKSININMCPLSDDSREIFMLSEKCNALGKELIESLSEQDRETLKSILVKGYDLIDEQGESFMAILGKIRAVTSHIQRVISKDMPIQTFEIWREGFEDEDGKEPAILLAKGVPGNDFPDAVDYWYRSTENAEHIYGTLSSKGEGAWRKMWLWGCRLYDNEVDARKRFG